MTDKYIIMEVGCIDCAEKSDIIGVYDLPRANMVTLKKMFEDNYMKPNARKGEIHVFKMPKDNIMNHSYNNLWVGQAEQLKGITSAS